MILMMMIPMLTLMTKPEPEAVTEHQSMPSAVPSRLGGRERWSETRRPIRNAKGGQAACGVAANRFMNNNNNTNNNNNKSRSGGRFATQRAASSRAARRRLRPRGRAAAPAAVLGGDSDRLVFCRSRSGVLSGGGADGDLGGALPEPDGRYGRVFVTRIIAYSSKTRLFRRRG